MKRGDIWTVAGAGYYTGKPRPAVILQDDNFDTTDSITLCAFTTDPLSAFLIRIPVEPSPVNGLDATSWLMVDKISTVPRSRLGQQIGRLEEDSMTTLERAVLTFLGISGRPETTPPPTLKNQAIADREARVAMRHPASSNRPTKS